MIPGLSTALQGVGLSVVYGASANNVDPWVALGSPSQALIVSIYVGSGVVIGSTSPASPAMLLQFASGSIINLFVTGKVGAAGGLGGGGDRGRNNGTASSFAGGGGGGGAGTTAGTGGAKATGGSPPPSTNTDGTAGTATLGGAAGVNEFTTPGNAGYTAGSIVNRLARNPAILIWPPSGSITVNVWNNGSIFAGGDGGLGGFQNAALPGGAQAPVAGEDLPAYYDPAPGVLVDHPAIGYRSGKVTLNLMTGNVHPSIKGRIVPFTSVP